MDVYLVFDPNNVLQTAVKDGAAGKFAGIPCEVPWVRLLESRWYLVRFYTDTDWYHCAPQE